MKRTLYTLLLLSFSILLYGQSVPPQGITYQAVLIDKEAIQLAGSDISGRYLANEKVEVKFTIVYDQFRIVEYVETHETTTDAYGLINLVIGQGTPLGGDFTKIKWEEEPKYLQVEVKLDGEDWELFSLERLWSVPYALYTERSKFADSLRGGITDRDSQLLSIVGDSLFISNGNAVFLPKAVDTSNTNEFQDLLLKGDSLLITNGKGVLLPNDEDVDSTNELQELSRLGDSVYISNTIQGVSIRDADFDSLNELQDLSVNGDTLMITKGNYVILPDESSTNELQGIYRNGDSIGLDRVSMKVDIRDGDHDSLNEIQFLSLSRDTVYLNKGGGSFVLSDNDSTNEIQNLTVSGDTIFLSKSNYILVSDVLASQNQSKSFTKNFKEVWDTSATRIGSVLLDSFDLNENDRVVMIMRFNSADKQNIELIDSSGTGVTGLIREHQVSYDGRSKMSLVNKHFPDLRNGYGSMTEWRLPITKSGRYFVRWNWEQGSGSPNFVKSPTIWFELN